MKVRGTSDFTVENGLDQASVQAALQAALDKFAAEHPQVLAATVALGGGPGQLRVAVILRSDSYGAAEDLMIKVPALLRGAVTDQPEKSYFTQGATELVPA